MKNSSQIKSQSSQNKADLLWKANDRKAQKNGSHSNIYWVKVKVNLLLETAFKRRRIREGKQMDWGS